MSSSDTLINKEIDDDVSEVITTSPVNNNNSNTNEELENFGDISNYCSFLNPDCVSVNSIPFNEDDVYVKKAINDIKTIVKQIQNIQKSIEHFHGTSNDQEYLFLEDTLIKLNMKLDAINSNGNDIIKDQRKSAVLFVDYCLKLLDSKLISNNNKKE